MAGSYNQVTPLSLGQSKKIKTSNTNSASSQTNQINSIPVPLPVRSTFDGANLANFIPAPVHMQWISPLVSIPLPTQSGLLEHYSHKSNGNILKKQKIKKKTSNNGWNSMYIDDPLTDLDRKRKRAEKFNTPIIKSNNNDRIEENFHNLNAISTTSHKYDKNNHIIGRCQNLEKSYLRLTSEPNPDLIRPLDILKRTFDMLVKKHRKNETTYQYICDQFKSMRQDLRVQMIENQFTVKVYQTHARIALENNDIGEFNQCQSRLMILFEKTSIKQSHIEEFTTYRILYYILTENNAAITTLRKRLIAKEKHIFSNYMVQNAFNMANSNITNDYHTFMKCYSTIEGLGRKLTSTFIDKIRMKSLVTICSSYNQTSLKFLNDELQFGGMEETKKYFTNKNLDKFIVTKHLGEETEYSYLDAKSCRPYIIQNYSISRKIDIKGQQ